jgi:hypothetical protein
VFAPARGPGLCPQLRAAALCYADGRGIGVQLADDSEPFANGLRTVYRVASAFANGLRTAAGPPTGVGPTAGGTSGQPKGKAALLLLAPRLTRGGPLLSSLPAKLTS